jgi:DNA mismatch repair protein MutL
MGVIRVLPSEIAGRIAAGEVIERPASVIKELVENSIDAGATRIRVFTEQGGQKLMQVVDDGRGMDRADAMLCLEAHATSKITKEGDVGQIATLGFRGEALPSISAVSHFQLQTRPHDDLAGTEVVVNNGAIQDVRECGCAPGTSIKVQWLFGNLPARRKFLRGASTEDDYIHEMMLLLALTRPQVSFELTQNGRCVLRAPASMGVAGRVEMLVGKDAFAAMLPVDYQEDGIHVYGYISRPGFTRGSRREQRIVVNGRAASAETVFFAIREAYETLVVKGRYPGVVLYVDIAPDRVDVNVHPTKREVRFREPMKVSKVVGAALRQGLRGLGLPADLPSEIYVGGTTPARQEAETPQFVDTTPTASAPSEDTPSPAAPVDTETIFGSAPVAAPPPVAPPPPPQSVRPPQPVLPTRPVTPVMPQAPRPIQTPLPFAPEPLPQPPVASAPEENAPAAAPASAPISVPSVAAFRLLAPLGKEYLLAESDSGLVVVNIRGASQRILFERLLSNLHREKALKQPLLIPVTLHLAPDEARLLAREIPYFQSVGFSVEEFGSHTFLVTAVPPSLPDKDLDTTIRDILNDLRQETVTNRQSAIHLAQLASRHGIRRKDTLSHEEQLLLLKELMACEMPYADPAGLPTMVHITESELRKRFRS